MLYDRATSFFLLGKLSVRIFEQTIGYVREDITAKKKKIFPKRIFITMSFIGVTYSSVHKSRAASLLKKSLPTKRGVTLLNILPKAVVQTSPYLVLRFSTCGFCPFWGQMTFS